MIRGEAFHLLFALLSLWFVGGLYLDGWAHNHLSETLETFFTPWHAVFYAGFAAVAALLIARLRVGSRIGKGWAAGGTGGYGESLLGVAIFASGGATDLIWHGFFGIEVGLEPLLSPPHLLLALGLGLIVGGPLRVAWRRSSESVTPRTLSAAVLSLTLVLSLLTFFTQFAHPLVEAWATESNLADHEAMLAEAGPRLAGEIAPAVGVLSILLQTALLMGAILPVVRRWKLPFGSLALLFGVNAVLMSFMNDQQRLVPAALLAGLVADRLAQVLQPHLDLRGFQVFAAAVPLVLYLLYFGTWAVTDRIIWSATLSAGSVILAALAGWLVATVVSALARTEGPRSVTEGER